MVANETAKLAVIRPESVCPPSRPIDPLNVIREMFVSGIRSRRAHRLRQYGSDIGPSTKLCKYFSKIQF